MKLSSKRIALLTGASFTAVGLAVPADAAPVVTPGTSSVTTDVNVSDTLDISNIGDVGVVDVENPASAIVNSVATGQILQGAVATGVAPTNGNVDLLMTNAAAGSANVGATATAVNAAGNATADAQIYNYGVAQTGTGPGTVGLTIQNDGTLGVAAVANATGTGAAVAHATFDGSAGFGYGIYQSGNGGAGATAINLAINNGTAGVINVAATANANGGTDASALADVDGGILQIGGVGSAIDANITNDGAINVAANAAANAASGAAVADANIRLGVVNVAYSAATGTAEIDNTGTIGVNAAAVAVATSTANAAAHVVFGVGNSVYAGSAHAIIDNSGKIDIAAKATATGATANASALVGGATTFGGSAAGIAQGVVTFGGPGSVSLTNSGTIAIAATANANGTALANANAMADGILQQVAGTATSTASIVNSAAGSISVAANANAVATTSAFANAAAFGAVQSAASAAFSNAGHYSVSANAVASASAGTATAFARGLVQNGVAAPIALSDTNSGTFSVTAKATAPDGAFADAVGISAVVSGSTPLVATQQAALSGSITNSGTLNVVAIANGGGNFTTTTGLGAVVTHTQSSAHATGIALTSGVNTLTVTNTGTIDVDAVTNGGAASAVGIRVAGNGTGLAPTADDVFTFTNDGGTIRVRQSTDGGATWTHGTAIDTTAAPNPSVINLLGTTQAGNIYGDINVAAADTINVETGLTYFDGVINRASMPVGGLVAASLDSGLAGNGALNIVNGGNLELADPRATGDATMYDGPAIAFVNTLNVDADSTLTLQLQPAAGGAQPVGSYPQIYTTTATLAGTLALDVHPVHGLFANSYSWANVIDAGANGLGGTEFDHCVLAGSVAGSPLLSGPVCTYDQANGNVSVALSRVAFNAVTGLTKNENAVATAIENVYNINLTGPFSGLVADLFTLNSANYLNALDQLSGVQYANYLHAVRNNTFDVNSQISDQLDCTVNGGIHGCADPKTGGRMWFLGGYNHSKLDSNSDAIGYNADNWNLAIGGNYQTGNLSFGAFAGYRNLKVDFPSSYGGQITGKGLQVGLDAAYDIGAFYGRVIGSYSHLNGNSHRNIDIGTISGQIDGSPDMKVWSLYGEAGGRFDLGGSILTPYAALDYASMRLEDFTETGTLGAELTLPSQTEHQTSGLIGVKWSGDFDGIVPEAKVAYRHDFGGDLGVDELFAGAPGSDFVKEEDRKANSVIAGLSLAGALGSNVTGRIGYQGRFNSEVTDHSLYGSVTLHFGAKAAPPPPPPPPPPVAAPPPPPPPPAPPPPPPPPPVERGERG